jgi:type II restriction/modification system DNA methylase subunit YeeA
MASRRDGPQQSLTFQTLTPMAFADKWRRSKTSERAAAQEHFVDLCALLGVPTPNAVDPTGESYAFEKGAMKTTGGEGFADVWKRNHFAWEYKRKRKNLDEAYGQLLQYREALENPPLLVVCDMHRFEIHTNFTGTAKQVHRFNLDDLYENPEQPLKLLRAVFSHPDDLRPDRTREQVTEEVAEQFGLLAGQLRRRGHDSLDVARFLNRLLFCFFAEDARLLPKKVVSRILETAAGDPRKVTLLLRDLFSKMAKKDGGYFGADEIQWFNGGLFQDDSTLPLEAKDLRILADVARVDWAEVEPAILGTLFERAIDPTKRSQQGAHYTDKDSIMSVIEPVVMMPLRREFETMKDEVRRLVGKGKRATAAAKGKENPNRVFRDFLHRLRTLRILDPACGSGNFLYLALRAVKDLEKEAIVWAAGTMGWSQEFPGVGPQIVRGIEINGYAAELARVSVWIGEIQWMIANGFGYQRDPVLRPLERIEHRDAILIQDDTKPTEAVWPTAEFIIGNPPFLGGKLLRRGLGNDYVEQLFRVYRGRVAAESDLVCYWFAKARAELDAGRARRIGLLATQGIRGGKNRLVLDAIKETGDIFLAWADREWVVDGAEVHVSVVGFDDGSEQERSRDGARVLNINADLSVGLDLTKAPVLHENEDIAFQGDSKGGDFDIDDDVAHDLLRRKNPHGRSNRDVVVRWVNGMHVTRQPKPMWIIDFGVDMSEDEAALYEAPFEYVKKHVRQKRLSNNREAYAERWWLHVEPRPSMRRKIRGLDRFIGTVRHAKHRIFFWIPKGTLPDSALIVFAKDDDYTFGVLQSRVHTAWSLAKGTQVREKETGFRYTPTSTFQTFPFPRPSLAQRAAIGAWALKLNQLRETRLHPNDGSDDDELTLTNLYTENPTWLQKAHLNLDRATLAAYGWNADISDDELLLKLLGLSFERANEEAARSGDTSSITGLAGAVRRPARAADPSAPVQGRPKRARE